MQVAETAVVISRDGEYFLQTGLRKPGNQFICDFPLWPFLEQVASKDQAAHLLPGKQGAKRCKHRLQVR
jgi:hypothetical protein